MNPGNGQAQYGSDLMADMLRLLDIKYAALNPGSSYRGLHDSIVNYLGNSNPETILCTHEGIAVSFAHGYGKVAGKPIAAMVHNIVGLLNAANATYNALLDEAPILIIGGTGPMDIEKRRPWIDWIHTALVQGNAVRDYVKWDDQPTSLGGISDSFLRAYRIATTDPQGPVYLCMDAGLQEEPLNGRVSLPLIARYPNPTPPQADMATLVQVAGLLVEAENPVVIADIMGRNRETVASLVELAELLALPVIDAGGRFNFPNTHPLDLTGAEKELLKEADVVLALDVQHLSQYLTEVVRYTRQQSTSVVPENCQVIHFSLQHLATKSWSQSFGKLIPVDIAVAADTALVLPELTKACRELLTERRRADLKLRFINLKTRHEALRQQWQAAADKEKGKSPIPVPWLIKQLWELVKDEDWALVSGDMAGWGRRLWDWDKPYQFVGFEGLGCSLGHSLGAALAHQPEGRLCIDFQPDGDLLFTPGALYTAAHHQIPLLVIMNNNRTYYNSELHQQMVAKSRERPVENKGIGTHIKGPEVDYAALACSFGLHGVGPIDNPNDLIPALKEAIRVVKEEKKLALVDVVTEPTR